MALIDFTLSNARRLYSSMGNPLGLIKGLRNSIHVHCVCLAECINKWVERKAVRGGWMPLSGLICEIVNSVGQGNFTFVREKSGNFKHLWLWQPCYSFPPFIKELLSGKTLTLSVLQITKQ